ncbi:MAG: hypothetical protein KAV87_30960, partial [Desulfobacteraceae bacterium]|nr:hypothetical protein [Desulfobacteraceae bacterium]
WCKASGRARVTPFLRFNFLVLFKSFGINIDSFLFLEVVRVSERRYLKKNTTDLCRGQIYAV